MLREVDLSNPGSWEDVVELLIPELQRRGIYWEDYTVPGGTFRENMQGKPGECLLPDDHPGAKLRWNAKKSELEGNVGKVDKTAVETLSVARS